MCLEVTETALLHDLSQIGETVRWLGEYGTLAAVDDFGAGYASLAYIRQLPVHLLKVDSQYVAGVGVDTRDEHLILAMTLLGHDLGLKVLAEGVETQAQLEWLAKTGCDFAQGINRFGSCLQPYIRTGLDLFVDPARIASCLNCWALVGTLPALKALGFIRHLSRFCLRRFGGFLLHWGRLQCSTYCQFPPARATQVLQRKPSQHGYAVRANSPP